MERPPEESFLKHVSSYDLLADSQVVEDSDSEGEYFDDSESEEGDYNHEDIDDEDHDQEQTQGTNTTNAANNGHQESSSSSSPNNKPLAVSQVELGFSSMAGNMPSGQLLLQTNTTPPLNQVLLETLPFASTDAVQTSSGASGSLSSIPRKRKASASHEDGVFQLNTVAVRQQSKSVRFDGSNPLPTSSESSSLDGTSSPKRIKVITSLQTDGDEHEVPSTPPRIPSEKPSSLPVAFAEARGSAHDFTRRPPPSQSPVSQWIASMRQTATANLNLKAELEAQVKQLAALTPTSQTAVAENSVPQLEALINNALTRANELLETRLRDLEGALQGLGNIPYPVADQSSHPMASPAPRSVVTTPKTDEVVILESKVRTLQSELQNSGAMIQFLSDKMSELEKEVFRR